MGLEDDPFIYRITEGGVVLINRHGRTIARIGGERGERLIAELGHDDATDQQLLARATGNYRRGNERNAGRP